jgi:hypothetical protein
MQFSTLDELLLQRIDDLDDFTRKTLHLAAVLGHTFTLADIIGVSEHVLSIAEKDKFSHTKKMRSSLDQAVEEGILDEAVVDEVDDATVPIQNLSINLFPDLDKEEKSEDFYLPQNDDLCFHFSHDTWRQKILSLLLDSYKRDIHMHAASTIESNTLDIEESDYRTKMRLFVHLKQSGNTSKAAELALHVGKTFSNVDLNLHSIRVYDEALDMWRKNRVVEDDDKSVAGFSRHVISSIDSFDLIMIIKLLTALGQALGTLTRKLESARAFEDALEVSDELSFLIIQFVLSHDLFLTSDYVYALVTNPHRYSSNPPSAQK